ncbi:MAG: DUF4357 domain-containing protein [Candidatus Cloacimonetes bacterium]|nr:DUF4357 domain-containing protein [Candidatus Cloacimonadota bacterium]
MKEIIKNIRSLLADRVFLDEQHVRFSLVGRICKKLGWNIWNPAEFHTEYKVQKVPTQILPKDSSGRVDVALFLSDKNSKAAEVFMEIKSPGKLMPFLKECEDQLHAYTGHHRIAIGILTDGIIWRFYVPAIGGYFKDTLFAQLNLEKDDIDTLVTFFNDILHRDNFRKKAQDKAEQMFEELGNIELVQKVKYQAIDIAKATGMEMHLIAQRLLKQNDGTEMDIELIQRLWNKSIPAVTDHTPKHPEQPSPSMRITPAKGDYVEAFISARGVKASGRFNRNTKEFILYKGSEVVVNHTSTFTGNYLANKKRMIEAGILVLDPSNTKYILTQDVSFNAPSPASHLVLGRSSSGYVDWKDSKGIALEEYKLK